jgi:hypothetical protein
MTGRHTDAQIDMHAVGRLGVVDGVDADTWQQPVVAGTGNQEVAPVLSEHAVVPGAVTDLVVSAPGIDRVVATEGDDHIPVFGAGQHVVAFGADDRRRGPVARLDRPGSSAHRGQGHGRD